MSTWWKFAAIRKYIYVPGVKGLTMSANEFDKWNLCCLKFINFWCCWNGLLLKLCHTAVMGRKVGCLVCDDRVDKNPICSQWEKISVPLQHFSALLDWPFLPGWVIAAVWPVPRCLSCRVHEDNSSRGWLRVWRLWKWKVPHVWGCGLGQAWPLQVRLSHLHSYDLSRKWVVSN